MAVLTGDWCSSDMLRSTIYQSIIILLIFISVASMAQAQKELSALPPRWSFEFHLGMAYNLKLPLTIVQAGYPDIDIAMADFKSESLTAPYYWDWRFTKWFARGGVSFEAIHHKIYLRGVLKFNHLTVN